MYFPPCAKRFSRLCAFPRSGLMDGLCKVVVKTTLNKVNAKTRYSQVWVKVGSEPKPEQSQCISKQMIHICMSYRYIFHESTILGLKKLTAMVNHAEVKHKNQFESNTSGLKTRPKNCSPRSFWRLGLIIASRSSNVFVRRQLSVVVTDGVVYLQVSHSLMTPSRGKAAEQWRQALRSACYCGRTGLSARDRRYYC